MTSRLSSIRLKFVVSLMPYLERLMKSLFEALLRLYEFDGPAPAAPKSEAKVRIEGRPLDPSAEDASTFSYLP